MKKGLFIFLLILTAISIQTCRQKIGRSVLLFSYFKGNGEDGLHLAYSYDGFKWIALKNDQSFLEPSAGKDKLMRDPCILVGPDNKFHLVWTVSWAEKGIGYANSDDLINWSDQIYIPVMEHEPAAQNCWAPEIFYDDNSHQYFIFWATTIPGKFPATDNQSNEGSPKPGKNHRIYYVTTKDFKTFSQTNLFYDHGFNVIDATIVKDNNRYVMFLKDETNKPFKPQKNIRIAYSNFIEGPYSTPTEPISGDDWAEGPSAIKIQNKWFVYFDLYRLNKYGLIVSDNLIDWTDMTDRLQYPEGMRHGTVFQVTESVLKKLLEIQ